MKADVPLVTLVVASYNHAAYARDCLNSVRAQTLRDFDLIVTDDASRDDSQTVIRELLEELSLEARLIFHEKNAGICRTFNEALALVRTPYVCFLAMDDRMREDRLEAQAKTLSMLGDDFGLVYSDALVFDADAPERTRLFSSFVKNRQQGTKTGNYHELLKGNWLSAPSVMMRADAVRAVGAYDESLIFEDYDLWCRMAREFEIHSIPDPLVEYRETPGSLSREMHRTPGFHFSTAKLLYKHLGVSPAVDEIISYQIFREAIAAYKAGADPRSVRRFLVPHARRHPTLTNFAWVVLPYLGRGVQRAVSRRSAAVG